MILTEHWMEDTCVVCNHNDTNYLDDCCGECEDIMIARVNGKEFGDKVVNDYFKGDK